MHEIHKYEEIKNKPAGSKAGYRSPVHSIAEYSYSVEYTEEGEVAQIYHSPQSKKITGYNPQDYYHDQDLWSKMIHEKDRENVIDFFNKIRNPEKEGKSNYYLEHRIRDKVGNIRWVSDNHNVIAREGKILRVEGFVLDITKYKQAEEELNQIIDNASDGIWVIDQNKRTTKCNPKMAEILGVSRKDVLGKSIFDFVDEKGAHIFEEMSRKREGQKKGVEFEVELIRPGGIKVPCLFATASLKGEISASYAIVKKITKRKRAEDELRKAKETAEEATKLKDKFVALVAHDLRSPLSTQLGLIGLLEVRHNFSEGEKDLVKRIKKNSKFLLNMIDRLLDIGRLHTGKIKPVFKRIDLWANIQTIVIYLRHSAEEKGINLLNEIPKRTEIHADWDLFAEVLQNLLTNAVKFCSKGDCIKIFLPEDKENTIAVQDTGTGISKNRLSSIFKYEETTSTVGTGGEKGTGLGLPICKDIIEAHGGNIWVESEEGKGSVFYIHLPPKNERGKCDSKTTC